MELDADGEQMITRGTRRIPTTSPALDPQRVGKFLRGHLLLAPSACQDWSVATLRMRHWLVSDVVRTLLGGLSFSRFLLR
jgi:hypothetical protein